MIIKSFYPATRFVALLLFIASAACNGSPERPERLLVLGDSISAALGMSLEEGWVSLMQQRLQRDYPGIEVVNASISGETSGGGSARLEALLEEHRPDIVILELGGNDGLRGYPINRFRANLESMGRRALDSGAELIVIGVELPPNYGKRYTEAFSGSYQWLAEELDASLVSFSIVAMFEQPGLIQADGIHPSASAQPLILDKVWPALQALLDD